MVVSASVVVAVVVVAAMVVTAAVESVGAAVVVVAGAVAAGGGSVVVSVNGVGSARTAPGATSTTAAASAATTRPPARTLDILPSRGPGREPGAGPRLARMPTPLTLRVNGTDHTLEVEPQTPLLYVLRNDLGLTAAKFGCGLEQCHACAVLVDGVAATSCATAVEAFVGKEITTLEGIGTPERLDPLQEAFLEEDAAQCGYCIPGVIVSARALLDRTPQPTDDEIRTALAPHLCRCGSQPRIVKAVRRAARA